MKICIAPAPFKESLGAADVAEAIAEGCRRACPGCECVLVPMADGGEGTVDAMVHATGGRLASAHVTGPMGEPVDAVFGILGGGDAAVIEMAAASGLPLVPPEKRNPLLATTFGTGELIRAALDAGARRIIVGIGGSATVDGGAGMAQALGIGLLDASGRPIPRGGGGLAQLAAVDLSGRDARIVGVTIEVACDVDSPLTGPQGAAAVYGPQKGATPEMVEQLDRNLAHLAAVIRRDVRLDIEHLPGAGAAGGLGAGLVAFLGARLRPGARIVMESVGLEGKMAGCDLALTGEGRIDGQTLRGKAPAAVAAVARKLTVPVVALAGSIGVDRAPLHQAGFGAVFSIADGPLSLADAMRDSRRLIAGAAEEAVRLFLLGRGA